MIDPRTPILVGGGQFTQRTARTGQLDQSLDPIAMLETASRLALADSGAGDALLRALDTVSVVRFTANSSDVGRAAEPHVPQSAFVTEPKAGRVSAPHLLHVCGRQHAAMAGQPHGRRNRERRVRCGASGRRGIYRDYARRAQAGFQSRLGRQGRTPAAIPTRSASCGPARALTKSPTVSTFPVNAYPLFENAIRGCRGRDVAAHLKYLGRFFSPFTKVASENPYSWFPTFRSPEEISTPSEKNRFVGFPYTKYLNAVIEVDMAASVVMTSVAKARELGIPESKWVFLHGCGDASDIWLVSERVNYHSSPAIRTIGRKAFAMAGKSIADMSFIDLYSCFPSAVELGCQELGIAEDDPRGLTITGGLPYFGGAGNNYVMHSIVTMLGKLRAKPGAFGLCTGNGWYVTKHSAGIYSTTPTVGSWKREDPKTYQKDIDAEPHPLVIEMPEGRATVETYTVVTDRKGKRFGIVVGRLEDGSRFLANTPDDAKTLDWMMKEEMLGRGGSVTTTEHNNLFRFD